MGDLGDSFIRLRKTTLDSLKMLLNIQFICKVMLTQHCDEKVYWKKGKF